VRTVSAADRRWDDMVVLCAANSYDGVKLADQHVAEHLARLVPVLYVDPPISRLSPLLKPKSVSLGKEVGLRLQAPGMARLTPIVAPLASRRGMTVVTTALARRHLRNATARLGGQVRAVISAWPQYQVFGSCGEAVRIYWAQDDFVGGAALLGLNAARLDAQERAVAAGASLILAASPVVADTWRTRGLETALIPYGADVDAYTGVDHAPLPTDVELRGPVAGFVGHINERIDLRMLEAVADRGRSILLVGPKNPAFAPRRLDALLGRPNVRWVGPKEFSALPGYLRLMDVGLVPYGDTQFNRGSFPLKILEYLAAGRAVVATDLPAVRWLDTDLVTVAAEPAAFADHVERLLSEARSPALIALRRAFAARHSWAKRAAEIHEAIR